MLITSKGQVTIPQRIRERHGLRPGTAVEFISERGGVHIRPRKKARNPAEEWLRQATGVVRNTTTAKLMRQTRGED